MFSETSCSVPRAPVPHLPSPSPNPRTPSLLVCPVAQFGPNSTQVKQLNYTIRIHDQSPRLVRTTSQMHAALLMSRFVIFPILGARLQIFGVLTSGPHPSSPPPPPVRHMIRKVHQVQWLCGREPFKIQTQLPGALPWPSAITNANAA